MVLDNECQNLKYEHKIIIELWYSYLGQGRRGICIDFRQNKDVVALIKIYSIKFLKFTRL